MDFTKIDKETLDFAYDLLRYSLRTGEMGKATHTEVYSLLDQCLLEKNRRLTAISSLVKLES